MVYGNSGPGLVIKLWARAGKHKLGARTGKHKLEAKSQGWGSSKRLEAGKYKHSCLDTECNRYTVEMIEINIDEFSKIKKQKLIFYLFIFILFTFGMFH